jgi:amino acid adenylation domain-containing protein
MTLMDLLQLLGNQGISLACDGDNLKVSAPKGALTAEIKQALASHKHELLSWLKQKEKPIEDAWPVCIPNIAERNHPYPLSDLQRGFFMAADTFMEFHVRPHYYIEKNIPNLDVVAYEAAWNKALKRHAGEIVVVREDGNLQVLENPQPLRCELIDLRGCSPAEIEQSLAATREAMMRAELPLDRWPWIDLRVSLWESEQGIQGRVHYNHNNFFSDGGGTTRFLKEIDAYYRDPSKQLPPLSLSVRDAVLTLEQLAESPSGKADQEYWEKRLPLLPGAPALPMRPSMERRTRSRLQRREMFMAADLWQQFKENARLHGLTPSAAVFAAYAEVIGAWSNQRHFVLSNMVTRRLPIHPEIFDILGNFASLYPLEINLREGEDFVTHARHIHQQVTRDTQHLRWGGMRVMQSLNQLQGGFGRAPIPFVIGSGLFMEGFERSDFSCLETSQVMLDHQFWELADGQYYYVWDLLEEFFPDGLIDDMLGAYHRLLEQLAQSPQSWLVHAHELIPAHQLAARESVVPAAIPPGGTCLDDFLDAAAQHYAAATAVVSGGDKISYQALDDASDVLATELVEMGVQRGDRIAVVTRRNCALSKAVFAVLKAGAAYIPVDPSLPEARREFYLNNSQARVVLVESCFREQFANSTIPVVLIDMNNSQSAGSRAAPLRPLRKNSDLAYLIYTSGSTGQPKGVMIDHRGAVNTILDINQRFKVGKDDKLFGVSSFGFDLSVYDIFGAAAAGACLVYPEPEQALNPAHWLDVMSSEGITLWNSAPPLANLMVEAAEFRKATLPNLRLVLLSGDWIPLDLPDRLRTLAPNAQVVSLGGATEASIWSIIYEIGEVKSGWPSIPYGYPMLNQPWYILDSWGRPSPEWVPGELYIGGIGLALGYWGDEEKTAGSFLKHPITGERIYRTGDLGRYLPGGLIEFLGRGDTQVKIQGHRIELGEIESQLCAQPGVSKAVVKVQRNSSGGQPQLAAYVVPATGVSLDWSTLKAELASRLPDYMVPRLFMSLPHIPLSANGKIDRKSLPPIVDQILGAIGRASRTPQGPTEEALAGIWSQVLKVDAVNATDNFFDLGGQSFEAVRIIGLIREVFGLALSIGDIWQHQELEVLAKVIANREGGKAFDPLVTIDTGGSGEPCFMVHPAGGNVLCYSEFGQRLSRPVFAFQSPGVDGQRLPPESIAEFASAYVERINQVQPNGSILLGGWSSGGLIAYEMASQLIAQGRKLSGVIVLDCPPPTIHTPVNERDLFDWFLSDLNLDETTLASLRQQTADSPDEDTRLQLTHDSLARLNHSLGGDLGQLTTI